MGQCVPKVKPKIPIKNDVEITEAINYAIVDKTMLPKDLVGSIHNPTYVVAHPQINGNLSKSSVNCQNEKKLVKNSNNLKGSKNNLNKEKFDNSIYNYIEYDYETVLNNKLSNDENKDYKNKNIYKTISIENTNTKTNSTSDINENNAKLSKRNINTHRGKKLLESNSIIEMTSL
jgi:hypothetical protein